MGKKKNPSIITSFDALSDQPAGRLHFDGKEDHKTILGGLCTIFVVILVILIILVSAMPIIKKEKPYN